MFGSGEGLVVDDITVVGVSAAHVRMVRCWRTGHRVVVGPL